MWNNPVIRVLAVVVAIAASVRLIFELLEPVWPFLLVALIALGLLRAMRWWRGRW